MFTDACGDRFGEYLRVDQYRDVRSLAQNGVGGLANAQEQQWQPTDDVGPAHDREVAHREQARQALCLHLGSADTAETEIDPVA